MRKNSVVHLSCQIEAIYSEISNVSTQIWPKRNQALCAGYRGFRGEILLTTWGDQVTCKKCLAAVEKQNWFEWVEKNYSRLHKKIGPGTINIK